MKPSGSPITPGSQRPTDTRSPPLWALGVYRTALQRSR